jgi:esterase/lipase
MSAATKIHIPAFFIVGIDDEVIPIEHTKDIFEDYAGDQKIIKMVKGRHNDNRPV